MKKLISLQIVALLISFVSITESNAQVQSTTVRADNGVTSKYESVPNDPLFFI